MNGPQSWLRFACLGSMMALAALPMPAVHAAERSSIKLPSGDTVTADDILSDPDRSVHATGKVVLTSARGNLWADRVDVTPAPPKPAAAPARSAVQEARATGHVRITSQPKPDEKMEATGTAGTYWPGTQKATLTGGVTVTMASPQLREPAVLTGAKADMDLAKRTVEVTRTEAAQVALRLHPKADASSTGAAAAAPINLDADRIHMDNAANRVTATGSPVMSSDQGTVHAETIWFDIDPKAHDVKTVHAENAVRIDSQDPQRGVFHATADAAVMNRDSDAIVLTGHVQGTNTRPDEPEPSQFRTEELTYDHKTGAIHMRALGEQPAQVRFKPKPKAPGAEGAAPAPGTTTSRSRHKRRGQ